MLPSHYFLNLYECGRVGHKFHCRSDANRMRGLGGRRRVALICVTPRKGGRAA